MQLPLLKSRRTKNFTLAGTLLAFTFGLLIWLNLAYIMPLKNLGVPNLDNDLSVFWAGTRTVWQGANPYSYEVAGVYRRIALEAGGTVDTFVNPFYLTLIFAPLALFALPEAALIWLTLTQGLLAGAVALLIRLSGQKVGPGVFLAGLGLALLWRYSFEVMILNNISILMLFGVVASCYLSRRGQPMWAGAVAALLLLKPQIIFLILPLLLVVPTPARPGQPATWWGPATRRRWTGFGLASLALAAYSFLLRPGWIVEWLQAASERSNPQFNSEMTSVRSLVTVVAGDSGLVPMIYGAAAGLIGLGWLALWWANRNNDRYFPFLLAVTVAVNLLAAPYTRSYDFTLLLIPLLIAFFTLRQLENRPGPARFRWSRLWIGLVIFPWPLHLLAINTTFAWENLVTLVMLTISLLVWKARQDFDARMEYNSSGEISN